MTDIENSNLKELELNRICNSIAATLKLIIGDVHDLQFWVGGEEAGWRAEELERRLALAEDFEKRVERLAEPIRKGDFFDFLDDEARRTRHTRGLISDAPPVSESVLSLVKREVLNQGLDGFVRRMLLMKDALWEIAVRSTQEDADVITDTFPWIDSIILEARRQ